jgi:hypothetical protein
MIEGEGIVITHEYKLTFIDPLSFIRTLFEALNMHNIFSVRLAFRL